MRSVKVSAFWHRGQCVAALLLVCLASTQAHAAVTSRCYTDNSTGFPMRTATDPATGLPACAAGFHCPHFVATDNSTHPRYCTPTPECAVKRNFGAACESPQGTQEPYACEAGYYCPNATAIVECPSGYFCPPAVTAPIACLPLSLCPAGTVKPAFFGGLVAVVALLTALVLAVVAYRRVLRWSNVPTDFEASALAAPPSPTSPVGAEHPQLAVQLSPAVAVLAEGFRRARGASRPLTIRADGLRVCAAGGAEVLQGVTAAFAPGKVTAIIGPGGCGKTVLLNAVLGRLPDGWTRHGALSVNGDASPAVTRRFRPRMGYVTQADVLHRELTVYQNLYYAARVRLPAAWPEADKDYFLSAVLEALQLTEKRDLPIGDEDTRGISGGQRRRASIGVELVAAPMALFLDEPTSGLDSTTALEVCSCLKAIAVEARLTVAMTINQPRVEIWDALDDVLVLARGGRTVYQGPQHHAQAYFEARGGLTFPADANPADIIVDAVAARGAELADRWDAAPQAFDDAVRPDADGMGPAEVGASVAFVGSPFWRQVLLVHNRALAKQFSDLQPMIVELVVMTLLGAVMGISFSDFSPRWALIEYPLISTTALAFMPQMFMYVQMCIGLASSAAGVGVFGKDRETYFREAVSGFNRGAYFLGSALASLPRIVLVALLFTTIFQLMPRLYPAFGPLFGAVLLTVWCTYGLSAIFAMVFSARNAPLVAAVASLCYACFSGFIAFPIGLKYLSHGFWASAVLHEIFFSPFERVYVSEADEYGWPRGSNGTAAGIMIAIGAIYYGVAFALMVGLNRRKQM